jgi:hypothetical protein
MALKRTRTEYSISCDACHREWVQVSEDRVPAELVEAASVGWNCLQALDAGPCLCPECRQEQEAQFDVLNG